MRTITLHEDIAIHPIGLGCMGMSEFYGQKDDHLSLTVMHAAVELGVNMFDTADLYGNGHNESLIGQFLRQSSQHPYIATKCGIVRHPEILPDGNFRRSYNGQKGYIISACENSLKRLGVETIDLYYLHRRDPDTLLEESVDAMATLVQQGKIRAVGLSEVTADEIHRANQVHPIACVQSEYSLWSRQAEQNVLAACRENKTRFIAFSPLGRGLVTSDIALESGDFRQNIPRFDSHHLNQNEPLFELLSDVAARNGITTAQVCLSWLLAQGDDIAAIPGTRHLTYLEQNMAAAQHPLSEADLKLLDRHFQPENISGDKYLIPS